MMEDKRLFPGLGTLGELRMLIALEREDIETIDPVAVLGDAGRQRSTGDEEESMAEIAKRNGLVPRKVAAAFLRTSEKTLMRLEDAGRIKRCRHTSRPVMYWARDVLKLASAQ